MNRVRTLLLACACIASTLALSACGNKKDTLSAPSAKSFPVMLDFFPNADHAALYSALAHQDFRAVGLDVKLEAPADPSEPLKLLAAGRVDLAISYEPELLLARDRGLKLVAIGALVQRPLTSIIALPGKHVSKVSDLAGKRVGTAGIPYQAAYLKTALEAANVNPSSVTEANVGFNLIPAMTSGQVDATLGGFWNYEGIQLQLKHKHPVVIPIDQAGVPTYNELIVVAREDEARHAGVDLRAFMQALTRGQREVRADPAAATAAAPGSQPLARRAPSAGIDQADTSGLGAEGIGQALRLAEPQGLGRLLPLDADPPSAQRRPRPGTATVHQRVPPRPGDLSGAQDSGQNRPTRAIARSVSGPIPEGVTSAAGARASPARTGRIVQTASARTVRS